MNEKKLMTQIFVENQLLIFTLRLNNFYSVLAYLSLYLSMILQNTNQ